MSGGILSSIISGGTAIIGAKITADGNSKAARTTAIANAQATEAENARIDEAIGVAAEQYGGAAEGRARAYTQAGNARIKGINQGANAKTQGNDAAYAELMEAEQQARTIAEDGMRKASELAANGFEKEAEELRAATQKQVALLGQKADSIRQGAADATKVYDQTRADTEGGQTYLREMVGRGDALSDEQRAQLEESRRQGNEAMRGSSMAGSGRTAAALLNKVENDGQNSMKTANRAAAAQAAGVLNSSYQAAGNNKATTAYNAGTAIGSTYGEQGSAIYSGASAVGKTYEGAANARAQGALGLAEIGASSERQQGGYGASRALSNASVASDRLTGVANEKGQAIGGAAGARADGRDKIGTVTINGRIKQGVNEGQSIKAGGAAAAGAQAANSTIWGQTVGDLGSTVSKSLKGVNNGSTTAATGTNPSFMDAMADPAKAAAYVV